MITLHLGARSYLPLRRLAVLLCVTAAAALAGAKLYGVAERGGGFNGLGWEIGTGYRYPGAVLAVLLVLPLLRRAILPGVSLLAVGDCAAAGVGLPIAVLRVGCFLAGCCHGLPSSLPWAVRFPAASPAWEAQLHAGLIDEHATASQPVHPLQLYFALAAAGVLVFLLWFRSRQRYDGQLILLFFVLDGAAKFLLEFLRFNYATHLQWMAIVSALVAGAILVGREVVTKKQGGSRFVKNEEPSPRSPASSGGGGHGGRRLLKRKGEIGMRRFVVFFALILLAPLASGSGLAENASGTGRASATYKGLVSAVSQERKFDFEVRRDDGQVLRGPVQIEGAEGFTGGDLGDVDWQVSGSRVTGTMTKLGRQVATFEGTVEGSEVRGTFKTANGTTGSWTAEAPAAQ